MTDGRPMYLARGDHAGERQGDTRVVVRAGFDLYECPRCGSQIRSLDRCAGCGWYDRAKWSQAIQAAIDAGEDVSQTDRRFVRGSRQ